MKYIIAAMFSVKGRLNRVAFLQRRCADTRRLQSPVTKPGESIRRFTTLDGLRGIAALAVAQYHGFYLFGAQLPSSYLAVDMFFILSGFVLSHAYERRIHDGMSIKSFMLARVIRFYRLYIFGTIAGLVYTLANIFIGNSDTTMFSIAIALLLSSLFLPTPPFTIHGNQALFPLLYPSWSLFLELVINFIYAIMVSFNISNRTLLILISIGAFATIYSSFQYNGLNSGFDWSNIGGGFGRVVYSFFLGVLICRLNFNWRGGVLPSILCIATVIFVFSVPVGEEMRPFFDLAVVFAVFPVLTIVAAASEGGVRLRRCFVLLGNASYAIYTLHVPLLRWGSSLSSNLFSVEPTDFIPWSGLCFVLAITLLAYAADRFYDVPARRFLASIARRFGPNTLVPKQIELPTSP